MSEETPAPQAQQTPQGVQVMLDERDMKTIYANAYRMHQTPEEVILDIGFNMANPNPQQQGQQAILFKINDRCIMNYSTAKRLAMSLTQLVRRYEQQFGEIQIQQPQQAPQQQG
ncbi:MAG: DUF3467 domain-containing protein [Phycisphaerae bacterium]